MNIKRWPNAERPREKLLKHGSKNLSDAELMAIFLRTGTIGMNAVDLARHLISEFGSLKALFSSSCEEFCRHKGLGEAKYVQLQAVLEMSRRYLAEEVKSVDIMTSPEVAKELLLSKLRDSEHEVFSVIFLDNNFGIIACEDLFEGTIDSSMVYPRIVVKHVLKHKAAAVIFAHNHPSGSCDPSMADIAVTDRLKKALDLIDVRVLDHFIVGSEVISFSERGLL